MTYNLRPNLRPEVRSELKSRGFFDLNCAPDVLDCIHAESLTLDKVVSSYSVLRAIKGSTLRAAERLVHVHFYGSPFLPVLTAHLLPVAYSVHISSKEALLKRPHRFVVGEFKRQPTPHQLSSALRSIARNSKGASLLVTCDSKSFEDVKVAASAYCSMPSATVGCFSVPDAKEVFSRRGADRSMSIVTRIGGSLLSSALALSDFVAGVIRDDSTTSQLTVLASKPRGTVRVETPQKYLTLTTEDAATLIADDFSFLKVG